MGEVRGVRTWSRGRARQNHKGREVGTKDRKREREAYGEHMATE